MNTVTGLSNPSGRIILEIEETEETEFKDWRIFTFYDQEGQNLEYQILVVKDSDYARSSIWQFPKNWDLA